MGSLAKAGLLDVEILMKLKSYCVLNACSLLGTLSHFKRLALPHFAHEETEAQSDLSKPK